MNKQAADTIFTLEDNLNFASRVQKQLDEAKTNRVTDYSSGHEQATAAAKALWQLVEVQAKRQLEVLNATPATEKEPF